MLATVELLMTKADKNSSYAWPVAGDEISFIIPASGDKPESTMSGVVVEEHREGETSQRVSAFGKNFALQHGDWWYYTPRPPIVAVTPQGCYETALARVIAENKPEDAEEVIDEP